MQSIETESKVLKTLEGDVSSRLIAKMRLKAYTFNSQKMPRIPKNMI